jgi:hypothetical protein
MFTGLIGGSPHFQEHLMRDPVLCLHKAGSWRCSQVISYLISYESIPMELTGIAVESALEVLVDDEHSLILEHIIRIRGHHLFHVV